MAKIDLDSRNTIALSGWGQQHDSLQVILPKAKHIDYAAIGGIAPLFSELYNQQCDVLVGWSLGAQLAVRAVVNNHLKPKFLVLIAPPFQYVACDEIESGINKKTFSLFKNAYKVAPNKTFRKFAAMVGKNDSNLLSILETLDTDRQNHQGWINWLDELGTFSCKGLDFRDFPDTLILHGDGDIVTNIEQSYLFADQIYKSRLEVYSECGHAPHLHDVDKTRNLILDEIEKIS